MDLYRIPKPALKAIANLASNKKTIYSSRQPIEFCKISGGFMFAMTASVVLKVPIEYLTENTDDAYVHHEVLKRIVKESNGSHYVITRDHVEEIAMEHIYNVPYPDEKKFLNPWPDATIDLAGKSHDLFFDAASKRGTFIELRTTMTGTQFRQCDAFGSATVLDLVQDLAVKSKCSIVTGGHCYDCALVRHAKTLKFTSVNLARLNGNQCLHFTKADGSQGIVIRMQPGISYEFIGELYKA